MEVVRGDGTGPGSSLRGAGLPEREGSLCACAERAGICQRCSGRCASRRRPRPRARRGAERCAPGQPEPPLPSWLSPRERGGARPPQHTGKGKRGSTVTAWDPLVQVHGVRALAGWRGGGAAERGEMSLLQALQAAPHVCKALQPPFTVSAVHRDSPGINQRRVGPDAPSVGRPGAPCGAGDARSHAHIATHPPRVHLHAWVYLYKASWGAFPLERVRLRGCAFF